jgi:hypothetical protein
VPHNNLSGSAECCLFNIRQFIKKLLIKLQPYAFLIKSLIKAIDEGTLFLGSAKIFANFKKEFNKIQRLG